MRRRALGPRLALATLALVAGACGSVTPSGSATGSAPPSALPASAGPATAVTSVPKPTLRPTAQRPPTPVPGASAAGEAGVFRTELVPHAGADGVHVVLTDLTGLVVEIAPSPPAEPSLVEGLTNPAGQPNALTYAWIGGTCDTLTSITFERDAGVLRLAVATKTTGEACDLMGVFRRIDIHLTEPIDAESVIVRTN